MSEPRQGSSRWAFGFAAAWLAALHAGSALASREGAAIADAVVTIAGIAAVVLGASIAAGALAGVAWSRRTGASCLKGAALGVATGVLAFVALVAIAVVATNVLGAFWIAYALWSTA